MALHEIIEMSSEYFVSRIVVIMLHNVAMIMYEMLFSYNKNKAKHCNAICEHIKKKESTFRLFFLSYTVLSLLLFLVQVFKAF